MDLKEYLDKYKMEIVSFWSAYPYGREDNGGNIVYKKRGPLSSNCKDPVVLLQGMLSGMANSSRCHIEVTFVTKNDSNSCCLAISHIPSYCGGIFFGYVSSFVDEFGYEAFRDLLGLIEAESDETGLLFMSMLDGEALEDIKGIGYKKYGSHINPRTGNELYIIGWEL